MILKRTCDEILEVIIPHCNFTIVWISDLHKDSEFSIWAKVKKYLQENPDYYIVIGGDSLDVMQFVKDKRASKTSLKQEHKEDDYANRIIQECRNDLVLPFKDRIISWNRGNHDNSIIRHHNIDLLSLICGVDVHLHEYSGYILLKSVYVSPKSGAKRISSQLIHFSHSPFSGGVRSKGSLSIDIAKANYPDADIWITEHLHDGFIHPITHEHISRETSSVYQKTKWYVQNIAAKQESQGKRNGFHYETNKGNRAAGILEMHFVTDKHTRRLCCEKINHIIF